MPRYLGAFQRAVGGSMPTKARKPCARLVPWHVTPHGRVDERTDGKRLTTPERGQKGGKRGSAICHPCAVGG